MDGNNEIAVEQTTRTPLPPLTGWALVVLSWLIPGAGFLAIGRFGRGLAVLALIQAPFLIGILLPGAVLMPIWTPGDWGANIVNSLTFVTQIGNGLMSLIWAFGASANLPFFVGVQAYDAHPLFELASFYLMVSGGLNYFCVCNFYDRHVASYRPIH